MGRDSKISQKKISKIDQQITLENSKIKEQKKRKKTVEKDKSQEGDRKRQI